MPLNQPYFMRTSPVVFSFLSAQIWGHVSKTGRGVDIYVCIHNIEQACLGRLGVRFRMQMHACITFGLKGSHLWSVDLHINVLYRSWAQTNLCLSLAMRHKYGQQKMTGGVSGGGGYRREVEEMGWRKFLETKIKDSKGGKSIEAQWKCMTCQVPTPMKRRSVWNWAQSHIRHWSFSWRKSISGIDFTSHCCFPGLFL